MGTIIPILCQGGIPVFADVNDTFNMDPAAVEQCITKRTRAIIVVHLFGNPCDMDAMVAISKRHDIVLIEDCSQAHMTEYKDRFVGTIGDIGCFSFQQSKHMTTGDGGMTITSNRAYYDRMKLFVDKGYARKGWGARAYLFHAPNYRMTELVGAVGLAQLEKLKAVVEKRRELGNYMTLLLSRIEGVAPAPVTAGAKHSYWQYPMRVDGVSAEEFANEMIRQKVWVSAGYTGKPIYLCSESLAAKKTYGDSEWPFNCNPGTTYEYTEGLCPRAEEILKHVICIPLDEGRDRQYVERVAAAVSSTMKKLVAGAVSATPVQVSGSPSSSRRATAKMSSPKIRVAIVGCGQMGRWHLDSYKTNPRVELVGFVDTSIDRAEQFAREVGGTAHKSHKELLEKESLDAASLCTVPSTHRDIAIDLLDAGVNVLCEKPLAISVAQAEEMSRRAKEQNRLLFTAFKFRFHDEVRRAKELIDAGSLGKILNFRLMFGGHIDMNGQWYSQKALSGGGIIMDNGPHAADLMCFLFGGVKSITAQVGSSQHLEVEDTAKLDVCMENQTVGTSDLSWSVRVPPRSYLEIYGEDGAATLDPEGISFKFKTYSEWKRVANQVDAKGAFARQIHYFVDAVLGNNPLSLGNGEGVASQRVIEAAYQSVELDRKINIVAATE
jgi:dTDP-4-amino-4,6-dideoxygalactose transaminase/predicted dehydrogenase